MRSSSLLKQKLINHLCVYQSEETNIYICVASLTIYTSPYTHNPIRCVPSSFSLVQLTRSCDVVTISNQDWGGGKFDHLKSREKKSEEKIHNLHALLTTWTKAG